MPTAVIRTPLSVLYEPEDGEASILYPMASTSREALAFDAGEAVSNAAVALRRMDTGEDATETSVDGTTLDGAIVTVTVSTLTRGVTYELLVTFTFADGEREARTLFIACVA